MEYLPKIVNSIGLIFDIIGAYLIWKYGLPTTAFLDDQFSHLPSGRVQINKPTDKRSYWGLLLLMVGFIFQLASNFILSFLSLFLFFFRFLAP
jgi:hypothetical protein